MSESVQTFRTVLEATGGNNVGIVVPDDVMAAFGRGRRVPVSVTVDGAYSYSTTIASIGGRSLASYNAATRAATSRGAGDEIEVRMQVDDTPRTVELPDPLRSALDADPAAAAAFTSLSPSKQKAHTLSISSAKTDETRQRRLDKVLATLLA